LLQKARKGPTGGDSPIDAKTGKPLWLNRTSTTRIGKPFDLTPKEENLGTDERFT
jgi:hypothetical protein